MTGLLALENLPSEAVAEAAIAAALVLEHVPQAIAILLRPGALSALVDAALDEAASAAPDDSCGKLSSCMLPAACCLSWFGQLKMRLWMQAGFFTRSALHNMKMPLSARSV